MKEEKNELVVFKFENKEVRTVVIDGEPWFVAKDVAEVLGYTWNGTQRIEHVPEEWRGVTSVVTPSGNQNMAILSEPGLYFFLNRSDKEPALPLQKLVAGEILPSIRKKGFYAAPGKDRVEQDEWKKNFPYPFILLDDAVSKMKEMRLSVSKGLMSVQEWRRVVLGDFGNYKPESDLISFIQNNLTITGNMDDYELVNELYARYVVQVEKPLSRNKFTLRVKTAFPCLEYKQKKINGYPLLVFCGCKWANVKIEGQSA